MQAGFCHQSQLSYSYSPLLDCVNCCTSLELLQLSFLLGLDGRRVFSVMTKERMYTVPEVAQFLGITTEAAPQRMIERRLEAAKELTR